MKHSKLSPELIARITQLREIDRLGFGQIASRLGLGYSKVANAYKSGERGLGSFVSRKRICHSPELIAKVTQHYEADKLSFGEIAALLGLNYKVVTCVYKTGRTQRENGRKKGDPKLPPAPKPGRRLSHVTEEEINARRSGMKSLPNLYRLEHPRYNGWQLRIRREGVGFTHYFSDLRYKGPKKSLAVAKRALCELLALIDNSKRGVGGRIAASTIREARRMLRDAL